MDVKKIDRKELTSNGKPVVKHFYFYKGKPMARIDGNFYMGGFNMSKNKIAAIFENEEILKKFVGGEFDETIKNLKDDEVLEV